MEWYQELICIRVGLSFPSRFTHNLKCSDPNKLGSNIDRYKDALNLKSLKSSNKNGDVQKKLKLKKQQGTILKGRCRKVVSEMKVFTNNAEPNSLASPFISGFLKSNPFLKNTYNIHGYVFVNIVQQKRYLRKNIFETRMHPSRMRTARALTIGLGGVTCLGVYLPRGVPAQGVYLPQGVYLSRGYLPEGGGTCPGTPFCEQNDRQVQKYYLAPNFICRQ